MCLKTKVSFFSLLFILLVCTIVETFATCILNRKTTCIKFRTTSHSVCAGLCAKTHFWLVRWVWGVGLRITTECEWIANAERRNELYEWINNNKSTNNNWFYCCFEFKMLKQQNIMQLSYIMTLDLKQLQHREDLRNAFDITKNFMHASISIVYTEMHISLCVSDRVDAFAFC